MITAARVIPGSFGQMLHEVKASESNPPLYYVLAWGWAKAFGTGEVGLRSLTALFGAATVPVVYFAARELASRRAGLIAAALVAVNPMLIWYSQEARSYSLLVFFGALALLFFARALNTRRGSDLALWALASALALCSHYFAVFAIAIEAVWLAVALRSRWRVVLPAIGVVVAVGVALVPLIVAQVNPTHLGWIDQGPLSTRLWDTGVSFLIGETGHVIAEPPRERYALIPAALVAIALLLAFARGSGRERRGAALGLVVGLGVVALASAAALLGRDYIVERNLLPALIPLGVAAAIGFGAERGAPRRAGPGDGAVRVLARLRHSRHPNREPAAARLPRADGESRPAAAAARDRHLGARRRRGPVLPGEGSPNASTAARTGCGRSTWSASRWQRDGRSPCRPPSTPWSGCG